MHNCSPPQIEDDAQLRRGNRCLEHLSAIYKSFNKAKTKKGKYQLLERTLKGGSNSLAAVRQFREDPAIAAVFRKHAAAILQGHLTKSKYNTCMGLLAARLMYL